MLYALRGTFAVGTVSLVLLAGAMPARAAEPTIDELVRAAKSGDAAARVKAVDQLGARGEKAAAAVEPLTGLLGDGSAEVRAHAVRSLGQIGAAAKPAVPQVAALLKDSDESVRRQAVSALAGIRPGPQVMVPLVVQILEDSDPGVQVRVLHAIADAGADAVPGAIEGLKDDRAAYWACLILRELGPVGKDAVPALAERLKDSRPQVRREAALALGAMQAAAAPAIAQLAAVLTDEHARTAATFALGEIGQLPPGAEAALQANAKSADKLLSTVSYWTLARVHPTDKALHREAAERLIARIAEPDANVRVVAARALASLPPDPEIMVPLWNNLLQSADEGTVHHALDALATLGPAVVPRLIDMLKHKTLRPHVIYILGQNGPAAAPAAGALAGLLADDDAQVATEAALTLAKIGPAASATVPALVAALQKEDAPNSHAVVFALGKIGPGAMSAEPKLLDALKSQDHSLAILSAWALGELHPKSAETAAKVLPVLVAGLSQPHAETRQEAANVLGSFGPLAKDALPALDKANQDESAAVRESAAAAARAIRGEAAK